MITSGRSSFPAIAPNALDLPYAVKTERWALWSRISGFSIVMILGLIVAAQFFYAKDGRSDGALWVMGGLALASICAWNLWRLRTPSVVLHADRIDARGFWGWRSLSRTDIAGVGQTVADRYGSYFYIYAKPHMGAPIRLAGRLRDDKIVAAWLAGASDPIAEAVAADRAAVLANPLYGLTESDRAARLKLVRRAMLILNAIFLAGAVWLFFTELNWIALTLAVAAFAVGTLVVVASRGLVVWRNGGRARPSALGSTAPLLAVIIHAGLFVTLIHPQPLLWIAALFGLTSAAFVSFYPLYGRGGLATGASIGVACTFAVYGAGALADVVFDTGPAHLTPKIVEHKWISTGRSTTHYIEVASSPESQIGSWSVSSGLYDKIAVGSYICESSHHGAVGIAWAAVERCPAGTDLHVPPPDRSYPEGAQRRGIEGAAVVLCSVTAENTLTDCRVQSETPQDYGFGAAAVTRVQAAGMVIDRTKLRTDGQYEVKVDFKLEP